MPQIHRTQGLDTAVMLFKGAAAAKAPKAPKTTAAAAPKAPKAPKTVAPATPGPAAPGGMPSPSAAPAAPPAPGAAPVNSATPGAPASFLSRAGANIGGHLEGIFNAGHQGVNAMGGGYQAGQQAAQAAGRGAAGQMFGGVGQAITQGANAFHSAGGTKPLAVGAGAAALGYGAYRAMQPSQQQQQPGRPRYTMTGY